MLLRGLEKIKTLSGLRSWIFRVRMKIVNGKARTDSLILVGGNRRGCCNL